MLAEFLVVAAIVATGAALLRFGLASGISVFCLAFLFINLPKTITAVFAGDDEHSGIVSFRQGGIPEQYVDTAAVAISLFLLLLLAGYWLAYSAEPTQPGEIKPITFNTGPQWLVILPLGLAFTVLSIGALHIGADSLIAKRHLGNSESSYWFLKAAFIVKAPFYLWLIDSHRTRAKGLAAAVAIVAGSTIGLLFSQRTAIMFFLADILLFLYLGSRVSRRVGIGLLSVALAANAAVFAARGWASTGLTRAMFESRYFLDIEKMAYLVGLRERVYPSDGLTGLRALQGGNSMHQRVGEVLGLAGVGIPPSLVGQLTLAYGLPLVVVVAPLVGMALGRLTSWGQTTRRPLVRLLIVMAIARAGYFLANSDATSFVLRWVLDVAVVLVAAAICYKRVPTAHVQPGHVSTAMR